MSTHWERFKQAARLEEPDQVPVAFIVDSPWLPGYAGLDTLDFFLYPDRWFEIHRGLLDRFPDAVWVPGFWVEYGMAAEPSAFMVPLGHYNEFVAPHLRRIFDEFEGLIRIYHNDIPCPHLHAALAEANFDVFNFTHEVDIARVKAEMGHRVAMMGNVPPLHVAVRQPPEVVAEFARACLDRAATGGGMILSVGGGVSPGTPAESLDAMLETARTWQAPTDPADIADWHGLLQRYDIVGDDRSGSRRRRRRRQHRA